MTKLSPSERDEKIAQSFEAKPTDPPLQILYGPAGGCLSPLGHWKWVPQRKWRRVDGQLVTDSMGHAVTDDNGSWQPVAAAEPWVTVKMLAWFTDTLMESDWTLLFYRTGGATFTDDIAKCYLKARSL